MQQRRLQDGFAGGALEVAAQSCFCSYCMGAGARCSPQHLGTKVCSRFAHGLAARSPSPRPAVISAAHLSISLTCSVCARQGHFWRAAACLRACCARASARTSSRWYPHGGCMGSGRRVVPDCAAERHEDVSMPAAVDHWSTAAGSDLYSARVVAMPKRPRNCPEVGRGRQLAPGPSR